MNENNLKTKKLINFGPSGRAVAQPIDKSLLDNIFEHLTMERYANVQYFSMYLWFQAVSYTHLTLPTICSV